MLRFFELTPSPNNLKVRMALRFKGLEFEQVLVDPRDRSPVIEVSGQELTPVIQDLERGVVINDSEAILQYLDANFPDTPRLFPRERAGRKACDAWKRRLDTEVARNWNPVFRYVIKATSAMDRDARNWFEAGLAELDSDLGDRDSFHGPGRPVCDLRVAGWIVYALPGEALIERVRLFRKFAEVFGVPAGKYTNLERFLVPWNERLG